jgi:hypothetical protein
MVHKKRKKLLIVAALLYLLFGVLAFFNIPGGHGEHHHTFAHNLTHIVLGMLLLWITFRFSPSGRQAACLILAASYVFLGAYGASLGETFTIAIIPEVVEFHAGDYAVHLATGMLFLGLGTLKRSNQPPSRGSE